MGQPIAKPEFCVVGYVYAPLTLVATGYDSISYRAGQEVLVTDFDKDELFNIIVPQQDETNYVSNAVFNFVLSLIVSLRFDYFDGTSGRHLHSEYVMQKQIPHEFNNLIAFNLLNNGNLEFEKDLDFLRDLRTSSEEYIIRNNLGKGGMGFFDFEYVPPSHSDQAGNINLICPLMSEVQKHVLAKRGGSIVEVPKTYTPSMADFMGA